MRCIWLSISVKGVGGAWLLLVGPCGVENPHENVSVYHGLHGFGQQGRGEGEARVGLHAVGVDGDDRNLRHAGFLQGTADEADVVGGAAAAAGLAHENGRVV